MPTISTPPRSPLHRLGPQKTCPSCDVIVPASAVFCPNCAQEMQSVPENARSIDDRQAQFQIPAFLLAAPEGRRFDEQRAGTGLIWLGLALLAVPVVTHNLSPLSVGAWGIGLALATAGIVRTRNDASSMMRAGGLTAAAGLLTLLLLGNQIVRHQSRSNDAPARSTLVNETPESESAGTDDPLALILTGSSRIYRGGPAHTGVQSGPGPEGNPYRSWRYDAGGDLRSTPAISEAVAYFGTRDGYLIALDLATHRPKWSFDLGGYPVRSSPAVANGTVFLANGFGVFAIDAETGQQLWKLPIDYAGESSPVVVDGVVYVASKKNRLYAIDAETGEQRWFFKTSGLLFGSPSVAGDTVVIGTDDGDLFALDRAHGYSIWKVKLDSGIYSTPAIDDSRIFVTTRNKTTVALELATGHEIWAYPIGGSTSPAVADGVVFIGSDDGGVYAIDAEKGGDPLWLFASGSSGVGAPVVAGDQLFFTAGATITCLDRATGGVVWHYPVGTDITTEPVVLDGYLFAGDKDGYFFAITGDAALAAAEQSSE